MDKLRIKVDPYVFEARFETAAAALGAVRAGATPDASGALRLVNEPSGGQHIALPGDTAFDDGDVACPA